MSKYDNFREKKRKEIYNSEPVAYCRNCLSLRIMKFDGSIDYCDECGSTEVAYTDIDSWDNMYVEKYGKHFLDK